MSETIPEPPDPAAMLTRRAYLQTDGFVRVTDGADLFFQGLRPQAVPMLPRMCGVGESAQGKDDWEIVFTDDGQIQPSSTALYAVSRMLSIPLVETSRDDTKRAAFFRKYGLNDAGAERAQKFFKYLQGFDDLDFTWRFAPAVASNITDEFVQNGHLSAEQRAALDLHDWADLIGSSWFSRLLHDMAFTNFGVYAGFGNEEGDFRRGAFLPYISKFLSLKDKSLLQNVTSPFIVGKTAESSGGPASLVASLSPQFREALHHLLRHPDEEAVFRLEMDPDSPGCPVARHSSWLPRELVETDPHVRNLVERGILTIDEAPPDAPRLRVRQDHTVIDTALEVLAGKLRTYQDNYGMPRFYRYSGAGSGRQVMHERA